MSKILDSPITLGLGINGAAAGFGLIMGGAFGHIFWLIGGGSVLLVGAGILGAFKIQQIYHRTPKQDQPVQESTISMTRIPQNKTIAVTPGGHTYIPNPATTPVLLENRLRWGHAQYSYENDQDKNL